MLRKAIKLDAIKLRQIAEVLTKNELGILFCAILDFEETGIKPINNKYFDLYYSDEVIL